MTPSGFEPESFYCQSSCRQDLCLKTPCYSTWPSAGLGVDGRRSTAELERQRCAEPVVEIIQQSCEQENDHCDSPGQRNVEIYHLTLDAGARVDIEDHTETTDSCQTMSTQNVWHMLEVVRTLKHCKTLKIAKRAAIFVLESFQGKTR